MMIGVAIQRAFELADRPVVDRWLRFAPALRQRYEEDYGRQRASELHAAIITGLIFYNVYSLTSLLLMPDIAPLGIVLRLGVFTPMMAGLAWLVKRAPPRWNERLVFLGSLGAQGFPVWQFWLTRDPLGLLTFGELALCIVYANMLLALRFPYAVLFNGYTLAITIVAIVTKPALSPVVALAFSIQIVTACAFALWANYRLERRRCTDYVLALAATLEAEAATRDAIEAEAKRHDFQVLSRTDALTSLPNRRHLAETVEEWWMTPDGFALLMVDIDHFKLYNDSFGHLVGDECLRRVADILASIAHGPDIFCARFGGEEFTILVRRQTVEDVVRWAHRVVEAVRSAMIAHPTRKDGVQIVTVSVGVALRHSNRVTLPDMLFDLADGALYVAKQRGRNGFALCETSFALSPVG